jgi:Protein of unknown function (DUF3768)
MSTPYDESDVHDSVPDVARIRELNDALRTSTDPIGALMMNGRLVITRGIASRGNEFITKAVAAVRAFKEFNADNDPWHEHDFAFLEVDGAKIFFKVDYYDAALEWHSPDASDPGVTRRVLTVALAEEY